MSWTKEGARQHLAKYIILDELPFRHVEGEGFRQYSHYMNPKFYPPSRITIARDIYNVYLDEKKKLKSVMSRERVCLTTDTWTSIQNINYMGVTSHWIDGDWKFHKKIIGFFQVANHKGDTIANEMMGCLKDWGIWKVFTVTVDNASSNDTTLQKLKKKLCKKKGGVVIGGDLLHMSKIRQIFTGTTWKVQGLHEGGEHSSKAVKRGGSEKNEIDRYLNEDNDDLGDDFDILASWKHNASRYKVLSRIARDVLASPISSIASESAFSTGGRILDPFMSSLSSKMVEALICSKNWLNSDGKPIVIREYMDGVEGYKDCVEVLPN
uniref:HAT C-terminal dimerisation domain-containing protein n=1 Tax=Cannabis sativa TaxID=3483 RepID=A0A803PI39_CANSA